VIDANNQTSLGTIVGAAAAGNVASLGLSAGHADIDSTVRAFIGEADVSAAGTTTPLFLPQGVLVEATSAADLLFYAAGAARAQDVGIAASALFNTVHDTTEAFIDDGANVSALNPLTTAFPNVEVHASHDRALLGIAGSSADTTRAGVGAA